MARTICAGTCPEIAGRMTYKMILLFGEFKTYDLHTFINALESSPVHCLKLRPSGNRRNPGNDGTAAILFET
jgi:hypothetical protein